MTPPLVPCSKSQTTENERLPNPILSLYRKIKKRTQDVCIGTQEAPETASGPCSRAFHITLCISFYRPVRYLMILAAGSNRELGINKLKSPYHILTKSVQGRQTHTLKVCTRTWWQTYSRYAKQGVGITESSERFAITVLGKTMNSVIFLNF